MRMSQIYECKYRCMNEKRLILNEEAEEALFNDTQIKMMKGEQFISRMETWELIIINYNQVPHNPLTFVMHGHFTNISYLTYHYICLIA